MWALAVLIGGCSGGGAGDSAAIDPSVAPVVTGVTYAECATMESAGELWQLAITVSDPQGDDTVGTGTVSVTRDGSGAVLAEESIACASGTCSGSLSSDRTGVGCALSGSIAFTFVVRDADGNTSAPLAYDTAG